MPRFKVMFGPEAERLYRAKLEDRNFDDSALDSAVIMLVDENEYNRDRTPPLFGRVWWYAPAREATERRDELDARRIWTSVSADSITVEAETRNPPAQVNISTAEESARRTALQAIPTDLSTGRRW